MGPFLSICCRGETPSASGSPLLRPSGVAGVERPKATVVVTGHKPALQPLPPGNPENDPYLNRAENGETIC